MKVNEIFASIEGEGKRAGLPATFIRLFGCNLRCSYCDSMYSVEGNDYTEMSIPQIMDKVKELGIPNITVTGGEPLIHSGIKKLLEALLNEGYDVNVETNGTMFLHRFIYDKDFNEDPLGCVTLKGTLFYTMDYKCGSSGMNTKMHLDIFSDLENFDVLKFVVGSREDLDEALSVLENIKSNPQVYFSPVFGKIEPKEIVQYLLNKKLYDCKVQIQMHKVIWDPDQRGV